jgi:hypothetical protein
MPPAKPHMDKARAKPTAASTERRQAGRASKPMDLQAKALKEQPPAPPAPAPAPAGPLAGVTGLFHKALETVHLASPSGAQQ